MGRTGGGGVEFDRLDDSSQLAATKDLTNAFTGYTRDYDNELDTATTKPAGLSARYGPEGMEHIRVLEKRNSLGLKQGRKEIGDLMTTEEFNSADLNHDKVIDDRELALFHENGSETRRVVKDGTVLMGLHRRNPDLFYRRIKPRKIPVARAYRRRRRVKDVQMASAAYAESVNIFNKTFGGTEKTPPAAPAGGGDKVASVAGVTAFFNAALRGIRPDAPSPGGP